MIDGTIEYTLWSIDVYFRWMLIEWEEVDVHRRARKEARPSGSRAPSASAWSMESCERVRVVGVRD